VAFFKREAFIYVLILRIYLIHLRKLQNIWKKTTRSILVKDINECLTFEECHISRRLLAVSFKEQQPARSGC
jgi:hypothetical protein